jgi:hypothetical protein
MTVINKALRDVEMQQLDANVLASFIVDRGRLGLVK